METALEITLTFFMIFLCMLCLFSVLVIARDIVREAASQSKKKKNDEEQKVVTVIKEVEVPVVKEEPMAVPFEEPVVTTPAPAPVPAPVEEIPAPVEIVEEHDESEVTFNKTRLTHLEKYEALSSLHKEFYDAIVKYAESKEGVRAFSNNNYCDYKIGANRLVRMMIKRGEIVCEFIFIDRDFKNYASTNNVKMKPAATSVKINEPSAVGVAKDGIDRVCQQIEEEKEYKKQLAREKRREQRQKAKEIEEGNN
ncbi:MAG: hypothetical protein IJW19_03765 [Clostridia bacterium]|nr:hypothetical protein [Clostridia bacterium]